MKNQERASKQDYNTLEEKKNDLEIETKVLKDSEKVADQRLRTKLQLFLDMVKVKLDEYKKF
jgi:hypothetical protein